MKLPFTPAGFFQVFAEYNGAMWPAVVALWLTTVVLLLRSVRFSHSAERRVAGLMFYLLCIGSGQAWSITACSSLGSIRPRGYSRFSSSRRDVCSCGSDSARTAYDIERQFRMYGPSWEPRLPCMRWHTRH